MARVFLSNETYNAATSGAQIFGAAGTEQVNVFSGTTGVSVASSVDRVDLAGNIADFTFSSFGAAMTIRDTAGNIVATVSDSGGKSVVFSDGALSAVYAGTTLTLGGVALTGTAAPITPAAADIDATTTSDAAGSTTGGTTGGAGQTFTLTADDDTFSGTSGDDTFTGAAGTLNNGDRLIDASTTDSDTLDVDLAADNIAPTVVNVENINVNLDVFAGANATLDAAGIFGATITMSSDKLGFNGVADVDNAGDNNVTAGSNVDELDVGNLEAGMVDAGSAGTVVVATLASTDVANVTVNGDVDLSVATATDLALTATAASVIALSPGVLTDITVTGDATIQGDADDLSLVITGGSVDVNASTGGALDVADYDVSGIEVSTTATLAISNADDQMIELTAADADLTVSGTGAVGSTVSVTVSADQGAGTGVTVDGVETSAISLTSAVDDVAVLTIEGDATVDVAGDVTIANLSSTNASDTVTITGTGNVDVTAGAAADVASVTSTGLTGNLTYAQNADVAITVTAGAGDDDITLATVDNDAEVDLGAGSNTVTFADLDGGTLAVTGGAGDDTVNIGGGGAVGTNGGATVGLALGGGDDIVVLGDINATNASTFGLDFGTGTADTLSLTDTDDLSGENISVAGLDIIDMNGSVTVGASLVSGEAFTILGAGGGSTLTVNSDAADQTIDLSGLVFDGTITNGVDNTVVDATAVVGVHTIIGSSVADAITVDGDDSVDVSDTGLTSAIDSITGFTTGGDEITIGLAGTATNFVSLDADSGATDQLASASAAVTYAETNAFDGTVQLAFLTDSDTGTDGWLVYDADADGTADAVVQMVGLTADTDMVFGDIVG